MGTVALRVKPVENAEIHCAAGPRAGSRKHWGFSRSLGGARWIEQGQASATSRSALRASRAPQRPTSLSFPTMTDNNRSTQTDTKQVVRANGRAARPRQPVSR
jgi:hypothetical protein